MSDISRTDPNRWGLPIHEWVESAIQRRELLHDGVRTFLARLTLALCLLVALLHLPGVPWWAYPVLLIPPLIQGTGEIASRYDLLLSAESRHAVVRHIAATTERAWQHGWTFNATGTMGTIAVVVLVFVGLAVVVPTTGPTWAVLVAWAAIILYAVSGVRSVMHDAHFAHPANASTRRRNNALRWFVAPAGSAALLAILFGVDHLRGPFSSSVRPALIILCLVPLLLRAEIALMERTYRAAAEVHDEDMASLRRAVSLRARDLSASATVGATQLLEAAEDPEARWAGDAIRMLPHLIQSLAETPPDREFIGLPLRAVTQAFTTVARERPGVTECRIDVDGLQPEELDTCLRVVSRICRTLRVRPAAGRAPAVLAVRRRPGDARTETGSSAPAAGPGTGDTHGNVVELRFRCECPTASDLTPLLSESVGEITDLVGGAVRLVGSGEVIDLRATIPVPTPREED